MGHLVLTGAYCRANWPPNRRFLGVAPGAPLNEHCRAAALAKVLCQGIVPRSPQYSVVECAMQRTGNDCKVIKSLPFPFTTMPIAFQAFTTMCSPADGRRQQLVRSNIRRCARTSDLGPADTGSACRIRQTARFSIRVPSTHWPVECFINPPF